MQWVWWDGPGQVGRSCKEVHSVLCWLLSCNLCSCKIPSIWVTWHSHDLCLNTGHRWPSQWQHHGDHLRKPVPHRLWTLPGKHQIFSGICL